MTYYAFTFPYTYSELQEQLTCFDRKHMKSSLECERILKDIIDKYSIVQQLNSSHTKAHAKKAKLVKMHKVDQSESPDIFLDDTARDGVQEEEILVQGLPLDDPGGSTSDMPSIQVRYIYFF
jgi:glutaredoxin